MAYTQTTSLTFGDQAENHTGMQKFGNPLATGLTCEEIALIHAKYGGNLIPLHMTLPGADRPGNEACVLLIPNGIRALGIDPDALFQEQLALDHDRKALHARSGREQTRTLQPLLCRFCTRAKL